MSREDWDDLKQFKKERRLARRKTMPSVVHSLLTHPGLHVEKLSPEHYRVRGKGAQLDKYFDYWPSTGYWRSKDGKTKGAGLPKLLKAVKGQGCPCGPTTQKLPDGRLVEKHIGDGEHVLS